MSPSDSPPARPDAHVVEELPALLAGELDLESSREVTGHLRSCTDCQHELVEVAAGIGLMRRLDALSDSESKSTASAVAVAAPRSGSWTRATKLAVAAVVLVLVGFASTAVLLANRDDAGPQARVELTPVAAGSGAGSVAMRASGTTQAMQVDTSLGAAPRDRYYEVWLLDRESGKMLPVGVLPPDGRGTYRLPNDLLAGYDTVDISLQPDDGSTQHSSESVLRADYA